MRRSETYDKGALVERMEPDNVAMEWTIFDENSNLIGTRPFTQSEINRTAEEGLEDTKNQAKDRLRVVTDGQLSGGLGAIIKDILISLELK